MCMENAVLVVFSVFEQQMRCGERCEPANPLHDLFCIHAFHVRFLSL